MTVPTNNEAIDLVAQDAAAFALYKHETPESIATSWETVGLPIVLAYREKANVILSQFLAARRLPVSGDNAELIADLRNIECYYGGELRDWMRNAVKQAADILSASQPREVEVTDDTSCPVCLGVGGYWAERWEPCSACNGTGRQAAALGGGDHAE